MKVTLPDIAKLPADPFPKVDFVSFAVVTLESPYAGDVGRNLRYLAACMRDCLLRGEAPFASHGLYTMDGVLDDRVPEQRTLGVRAGFLVRRRTDYTVVYTDLGITDGMLLGIHDADNYGHKIIYRKINWEDKQMTNVVSDDALVEDNTQSTPVFSSRVCPFCRKIGGPCLFRLPITVPSGNDYLYHVSCAPEAGGCGASSGRYMTGEAAWTAWFRVTGHPSGRYCLDEAKARLIEKHFEYSKPTADKTPRFEAIRIDGRRFAETLFRQTPEGEEQNLAFQKILEAAMWANAAIARNND